MSRSMIALSLGISLLVLAGLAGVTLYRQGLQPAFSGDAERRSSWRRRIPDGGASSSDGNEVPVATRPGAACEISSN